MQSEYAEGSREDSCARYDRLDQSLQRADRRAEAFLPDAREHASEHGEPGRSAEPDECFTDDDWLFYVTHETECPTGRHGLAAQLRDLELAPELMRDGDRSLGLMPETELLAATMERIRQSSDSGSGGDGGGGDAPLATRDPVRVPRADVGRPTVSPDGSEDVERAPARGVSFREIVRLAQVLRSTAISAGRDGAGPIPDPVPIASRVDCVDLNVRLVQITSGADSSALALHLAAYAASDGCRACANLVLGQLRRRAPWMTDRHDCRCFREALRNRALHDEAWYLVDEILGALAGHCLPCGRLRRQHPARPHADDMRFPPDVIDWMPVRATAAAPASASRSGVNTPALLTVKWHIARTGGGVGVVHVSWETKQHSHTGWELWLFQERDQPPARRISLGTGYRGQLTLTAEIVGFDPTRELRAYAVMQAPPDVE